MDFMERVVEDNSNLTTCHLIMDFMERIVEDNSNLPFDIDRLTAQ